MYLKCNYGLKVVNTKKLFFLFLILINDDFFVNRLKIAQKEFKQENIDLKSSILFLWLLQKH